MQILNSNQIEAKIKRLAIEILEHNLDAKELVFLGINNNGYGFAQLLISALPDMGIVSSLSRLQLNPANPLSDPISIEDRDISSLKDTNIIIVDDVANTGRTLFYALKPLLEIIPRQVQIAVMVDRKHKSFPIVADYVGLSLATTLKDDIEVQISDKKEKAVFLR